MFNPKIIENFNLEISKFKDQLKEQEEEAVEQEVKFDEKVHGEGINELNQNLLFEKLKRTIKRSTAPEKVISTLEKQKIVLVDDSYYSFKKGEEQEKALMVSSILKEILSIIGSRIKTYSKSMMIRLARLLGIDTTLIQGLLEIFDMIQAESKTRL